MFLAMLGPKVTRIFGSPFLGDLKVHIIESRFQMWLLASAIHCKIFVDIVDSLNSLYSSQYNT